MTFLWKLRWEQLIINTNVILWQHERLTLLWAYAGKMVYVNSPLTMATVTHIVTVILGGKKKQSILLFAGNLVTVSHLHRTPTQHVWLSNDKYLIIVGKNELHLTVLKYKLSSLTSFSCITLTHTMYISNFILNNIFYFHNHLWRKLNDLFKFEMQRINGFSQDPVDKGWLAQD